MGFPGWHSGAICPYCKPRYLIPSSHYCQERRKAEWKEWEERENIKKEEKEWIQKNKGYLKTLREKRQRECQDILIYNQMIKDSSKKPEDLIVSLEFSILSVLVNTDHSEFNVKYLESKYPELIRFYGPVTTIQSDDFARFYICKSEIRPTKYMPEYANRFQYHNDDLPENYSLNRWHARWLKDQKFTFPRENFNEVEIALKLDKLDPKNKRKLVTFISSLTASDIAYNKNIAKGGRVKITR
ncbi:hypothetical protein HYW75_02630 [Candidatus Pacearchaeota archaeon]|nr:hypothetical protein [Candidatus Pacearchaeota archaeon]